MTAMGSFGNGGRERRSDVDSRKLSSAAAECIDLAEEHLRAIELSAAATVEDLGFEREALADELSPAEREQVEEIFDAVIEHGRQVAARCSRLRRRSRRARNAVAAAAEPAPPAREVSRAARPRRANNNGPSEGVKLLSRQMALQGAPERQIEATLGALGVKHADDAVKRSLS